jgi:hypothetical protein
LFGVSGRNAKRSIRCAAFPEASAQCIEDVIPRHRLTIPPLILSSQFFLPIPKFAGGDGTFASASGRRKHPFYPSCKSCSSCPLVFSYQLISHQLQGRSGFPAFQPPGFPAFLSGKATQKFAVIRL